MWVCIIIYMKQNKNMKIQKISITQNKTKKYVVWYYVYIYRRGEDDPEAFPCSEDYNLQWILPKISLIKIMQTGLYVSAHNPTPKMHTETQNNL